jgi:uncharacterized membrane protein YjfL (UPF0719 family)
MTDLNTNEVTQISGGGTAAAIVLAGPIIAPMVPVAIGVSNQQNK